MPLEFSLAGIYLPAPLVLAVLSLPFYLLLDVVLARLGVYRRVLHPSLLRIALFVVVYASAVLILL